MTPLTPSQRALVEKHYHLAGEWTRQLVNRYPRLAPHREDVVQTATLGLMKAAQRFDPKRAKFSVIAWPHMLAAFQRVDANWLAPLRVPQSAKARGERQYRASETALRHHSVEANDGTAAIDVAAVLDGILGEAWVTAQHQRNVEMMIARVVDGEQLKDIGARYGISHQRVKQIVDRTLADCAEWATRVH